MLCCAGGMPWDALQAVSWADTQWGGLRAGHATSTPQPVFVRLEDPAAAADAAVAAAAAPAAKGGKKQQQQQPKVKKEKEAKKPSVAAA